jgi:hypothetical protein
MGKPYSMDLRKRVVAAVDPGGLSCHWGGQFGVGVNTAIIWVRRFREAPRAKPCGRLSVQSAHKLLFFLPKYFPDLNPNRAGLRQAQALATQSRRANRRSRLGRYRRGPQGLPPKGMRPLFRKLRIRINQKTFRSSRVLKNSA